MLKENREKKGYPTENKPIKKEQNRRRNHQIILRLTAAEKETVAQKKSATKHKSYADFFISAMSKKPYVIVTSLDEALTELKRQGNNLNQLAVVANSTGAVAFEEYLKATLREYIRVYRNLETLANEVRYGNS